MIAVMQHTNIGKVGPLTAFHSDLLIPNTGHASMWTKITLNGSTSLPPDLE